ncbi:MAG: hypothetical protein JNM66_08515 [Bryobacterales bacterium]|nr:hypothetical protein [Bryobacterales bacterium]
MAAGFFFVDPCVEDPFKSHIKVNGAGELEAQTPQGDYTKRTLRLDRKDCLDFRKERISARRALDDAEKVLDGLLTSSAPKERKDELKRMLRVVAQLRRCWAQFVDPPPQQLLHHIPKKYRRDVKIPSGAASV